MTQMSNVTECQKINGSENLLTFQFFNVLTHKWEGLRFAIVILKKFLLEAFLNLKFINERNIKVTDCLMGIEYLTAKNII